MGIKFTDFKIRGIDVSKFNDLVDWDKVKNSGVHFSAIRAGFGNTTDSKFLYNWTNSKGKVTRFAYWYMDYYSNWYNQQSVVYGISDEAWGKLQAKNCWDLIKIENNKIPTFLDIESGSSSYSPAITTCTSHAQGIAKAFLIELDRLSGIKNGIYCSYGLLSWFPAWFRDRPLWVAWYTDNQTPASILSNVKSKGWTGKCYMWQYASDGDIDDNGTGDGKTMGSGYAWLDLNGWIASDKDYEDFTNGLAPEPEKPETPLFQVKVVVTSLNIRNAPSLSGTKVGTAIYNKIYDVYETNGDWMRVGKDQWFYGISTYVQKIDGTSPATGKRPEKLYYPLPEGIRISQLFGKNPSWYPTSKGHNGIDWASNVGTPIYAMEDGEVIRADATSGKKDYGRHVRIKHKEGISIYGHLSVLYVKVGDMVKATQVIGLSGGATTDPASGFSTGPHLHAEYRVDNLPNPVPGGYAYNAFDILPILVSHTIPDGVTKWKVTSTIGLKIRSAPSITGERIGVLLYNEEFFVSSIDANNWGKLYNRDGYSLLDYAKKI